MSQPDTDQQHKMMRPLYFFTTTTRGRHFGVFQKKKMQLFCSGSSRCRRFAWLVSLSMLVWFHFPSARLSLFCSFDYVVIQLAAANHKFSRMPTNKSARKMPRVTASFLRHLATHPLLIFVRITPQVVENFKFTAKMWNLKTENFSMNLNQWEFHNYGSEFQLGVNCMSLIIYFCMLNLWFWVRNCWNIWNLRMFNLAGKLKLCWLAWIVTGYSGIYWFASLLKLEVEQ
jgi:hypothetical protein